MQLFGLNTPNAICDLREAFKMYPTEEWSNGQSELFYFTVIEKLRDRYQACIGTDGERRY